MGDLIVMTRPNEVTAREPRADGGSAEILFFTGVRYYRYDDAIPAPTQPVRRRRADKAAKPSDLHRAALTL